MTLPMRGRAGFRVRGLRPRLRAILGREREGAETPNDVAASEADESDTRPDLEPPDAGGKAGNGTGRRHGLVQRHPYLTASALYLVMTLLLFGWANEHASAEPFTWLAGISIWPSEIIRVFAGGIAVLLLIAGWRRVSETDQEIHCRYFEPPRGRDARDASQHEAGCARGFAAWFRRGRGKPSRGRRALELGACPPDCRQPPGAIARLLGDDTAPPAEQPDQTRAFQAWSEYRRHATLWARAKRILPAVALFWLLAVLVVWGFDTTAGPYRGGPALLVDAFIALGLLGLPLLALLFAAMDEAQLCVGLLRHLEQARGCWPLPAMPRPAASDQGRDEAGENDDLTESRTAESLSAERVKAISDLIAVEVIARRTDAAEYIIHLPFIVILFVLLSLSTWLDNWATPLSLLGLLLAVIAIGLISSLWLRRVALSIRRATLDDLAETVEGIEYDQADSAPAQLGLLRKRIESVRRGAYAKWYQEPVIQSVAWVIGIGVMPMTEYMRLGS